MRENTMKTAWANGEHTLGLWLSSPDSGIGESLGNHGFDYLNVDMQHGLIDYPATVDILRGMQRSASTPTVRVPWNEPGIIGKVLDAGALGVIVPMVNTVAEAEAAVSSCFYAPKGTRSYGPVRAGMALGPGYVPEAANEAVACIPMIETVEALANLDDILEVPGIDAIYVGPADLSISMGFAPGSDQEDPRYNEALDTLIAKCRNKGVVPGIHCTPALTPKRLEQGFRMVTVIADMLAMAVGAKTALRQARGEISGEDSGAIY